MTNFLDSNLFQSIIILVSGCLVFGIIKYNQFDEIRKCALILTMEIRDIENNFKEFVSLHNVNNYYFSSPILVYNSWEKNKHLFVSKLDQDEFVHINNFYKIVAELERERKHLKEVATEVFKSKSEYMQKSFIEIAKTDFALSDSEYDIKLSKIANKVFRNNPVFEADLPKIHINNLLKIYVPISTSSSMSKIKELSEKKILNIF